MMDKPDTPSSDDIAVIESFVISLYSVSCTLTDVNKARQQIFAQSSRTFEYLPPTKAALEEHIKRTTHQAGYGANPSSPSKCCLARASAQHNHHWTQHHNLLRAIAIHNCDYHYSYSYPCGYVFQLQRYSCNYGDS